MAIDNTEVIDGMRAVKLQELIQKLIVKMRCENEFDSKCYNDIKIELQEKIIEWNRNGYVLKSDVVAISSLIEQLVGGSRFFDEDTAIKVEDASIEIMDMIKQLNSSV